MGLPKRPANRMVASGGGGASISRSVANYARDQVGNVLAHSHGDGDQDAGMVSAMTHRARRILFSECGSFAVSPKLDGFLHIRSLPLTIEVVEKGATFLYRNRVVY